MDSLLRPENNYSHSGYSSYSQQSCYVDDVIVSGNRPDCQNGVPYEPTILSYPLTEINADYTIGTLIHPAYTADSSIFEIFLHFDLAKQNVGRRRKFRSIFGTFWGPLPHVGVVCPKTHRRYKAHSMPYHFAKYRANLISGSEDYPYH